MISEKEAKKLLKRYSPDEKTFRKVFKHSKAVQKAAIKIAKNIKNADLGFIKTASLLHDIGRFKCPPGKLAIQHGIAGARILKKEGLKKHSLVAERHLGAGIKKKDIKKQKLNLPLKDYMPKSIEEKIITHADNLVEGSKIRDLNYAVKRFRKELGEEYARRITRLHKNIKRMRR